MSRLQVILGTVAIMIAALALGGGLGGLIGHIWGTNLATITAALLVGMVCGFPGGLLSFMWFQARWPHAER